MTSSKGLLRFLSLVATLFLLVFLSSGMWAQNQPPVANAGPDITAYTGDVVVLRGAASDPDGDMIEAWSWGVISAPAGAQWLLPGADSQYATFTGYLAGDYVLRLAVTDGVYDSIPDYMTVHVRDNLPPVAVATADKTTVPIGGTVCFDGSQSSDPEGGPLTYVWDFADGSPFSYAVSSCHTYSMIGQFQANLNVIDERNGNSIDVVIINVVPPINHPPEASPEANPTTGSAPLTVQFTSNATDADSDALTYAWTFGDNTPVSHDTNPTHIYSAAGTYQVSLVVSDGKDPVTKTLSIVVAPPFTFSVSSASVKWTKRQTLANVDVRADLEAAMPAPGDVVTMKLDGIKLVEGEFRYFTYDPLAGTYTYSGNDAVVKLDFTNKSLFVHRNKLVAPSLDASNGVEVVFSIGSRTVVETIPMQEGINDRLLYDRP